MDPDDTEVRVTELAFSDPVTKYTALRDRVAPAAEKSDVASKAEEAENMFWKDMVAKGFKHKVHGGAGNPAGGRWQRALAKSPELRADYGKEKGQANQAKFREDWFEKGYKLYKDTKTVTTTSKATWSKEGRMLTLGRMAWKEGGGAAGIRAAINIAVDCIAVGGGWWKKDQRVNKCKFW